MVDSLCPASSGSKSLAGSPGQQGFTLIELLVVVVIVGLLAAIALPSFVGQAAKAKQARALQYIGVINRAQQAFFLENNRFAISTAELGFADENTDQNYIYTVTLDSIGTMTSTKATPVNQTLKGYAGVVFTTMDPSGDARIYSLICQGEPAQAPSPTVANAQGDVQIANCNTL